MKYLKELRKLNLIIGKYAVFGSGTLAIKGLRDNRDLDLIVKDDLWDELIKKYQVNSVGAIKIGNIEIWKEVGVGPQCDLTGFIFRAEMIEGLPYVNLTDLMGWKKLKGREKDIQDVKLIEDFLNQHNN